MAKDNWKQQPTRHVGQIHQTFNPDVVLIIEQETSTGRTMVKSGNGKPLNPFLCMQLALSVLQGNLNVVIQQQSMLINPNNNQPIADTPAAPEESKKDDTVQ